MSKLARNQHFVKGDTRYIGSALVAYKEAPDGEFDPVRDTVYEDAQFDNLEEALRWANEKDLHNNGDATLEEYSFGYWHTKERFDFQGKRLD